MTRWIIPPTMCAARHAGGASLARGPAGEVRLVRRLENPGKILLDQIEVQTGSYPGEDDITVSRTSIAGSSLGPGRLTQIAAAQALYPYCE
jgi:predicted dienelactone hydrolase